MGQTEQRLQELNIQLPDKNRKGQGVVEAKEANGLLYLSAQLPLDEKGNPIMTGRVGTDLTKEQGYEAARQCGIIALSVIRNNIRSLDHGECVIKVLGLVNSGVDFSEQPLLISSLTDLMLEVFGQRGFHARSAMGAYNLPQNCPVTVECIVKLR